MIDPLANYQSVATAAGVYEPWPLEGAGALGRTAPAGISSGALGYGSGGPTWLDAYHTKRPPTPSELVNAYKAVAYACIQLNAKGVAKVPLRLYAVRRQGMRAPRRSFQRASDLVQKRIRSKPGTDLGLARSIDTHDEIDEILDHPLLEALEKPNPYFDKPTLFMYMVACLDALGVAFLYPTRPAGADGMSDNTWAASEIWPLQPQWVYPTRDTGPGILGSWRYFQDTFAPKELVRIRHVSLRDPYLSGYAPLHAVYEQNSLVDYYTASVEGILRGGARPDIIMGPKDTMARFGADERERFETDINQQFSGSRKGRVWVVDGAFDVHNLTYPPTDLGGLELTKNQRLLVANALDVPISLLQSENSNRATAQESTHQHQYYAIDPRCMLIAAALTCQLAQPVDDRLFFMFDDCVTRDQKQDAEVWAMKLDNGAATPNEWRSDQGMPSVEWGDEPFIPSAKVQPSVTASRDKAEADSKAFEQKLAGDSAKAEADAKAATTTPDDGAPVATGVVPGQDVQGQVLNGAQISSFVEILQNVKDGIIPPESAKGLLAVAFPGLTPEAINKIVDPIKPDPEAAAAKLEAKKPMMPGAQPAGAPPKPGAAPKPDAAAERSAEIDDRVIRVLDALEGSLNGRPSYATLDDPSGDSGDSEERGIGGEHVRDSTGTADIGPAPGVVPTPGESGTVPDPEVTDSADPDPGGPVPPGGLE